MLNRRLAHSHNHKANCEKNNRQIEAGELFKKESNAKAAVVSILYSGRTAGEMKRERGKLESKKVVKMVLEHNGTFIFYGTEEQPTQFAINKRTDLH